MNILSERRSLIELWLESFKVVNRCAGKLVWVIIVAIGMSLLAFGILALTIGSSAVFAITQINTTSALGGIGTFILVYLLVVLGTNCYVMFLSTVFWRLIASQATKEIQPLFQTFSSSLVPTLYQMVAWILLAIPMILLEMLLHGSKTLEAIVMVILFFTVGIRLCYSFIAIAVANKGPIEGLVHSWKMTAGKNYIDTLLMCLLLIGSVLLMYLFFIAVGYGLFVMIPLHFADSFNLANPSLIWILVALVLGIIALFGYFIIMAFPVLVFLNRNAVLFDARTMEKDTTFVPLPALELPDIQPNPEHMQQTESTVRAPILSDEDLRTVQPTTSAQPAPKPAPAPTLKPQPQEMTSLDGLEVSKASINTSEEDTNTLSEHLDQVYTPKAEDIVQYGDEDRMPTILFDDEMAKQLQENQVPKPKEDKQDKKDNGPETIKMSKF